MFFIQGFNRKILYSSLTHDCLNRFFLGYMQSPGQQIEQLRAHLRLFKVSHVIIDRDQKVVEWEGDFQNWPLMRAPEKEAMLRWLSSQESDFLQKILASDFSTSIPDEIGGKDVYKLPNGDELILKALPGEEEQEYFLLSYVQVPEADLIVENNPPTEGGFSGEEFRRYQERLQYVTQATSDGFYDVDVIKQTIWRTDNFYTMFGYKPEHNTENFWWWRDMIHPDDMGPTMESMDVIFINKRPLWTWEYRFKKANGDYAIVLDRAYVIYGPKSQPTRLIGAVKDITHQRLAEKRIQTAERKLQAERKLLRTVTGNIKEAIYRIEPGQGMVYVNQAFADYFGFEQPRDVIRLNSKDLDLLYYDPTDRKRINNLLRDKGAIRNEEILFKSMDGTLFWGMESCIRQINEDGKVYLDGSITNIQELRNAKEELELKNAELEKINAELDRFVYSASHDLRAPLSSLLGLLNLTRHEDDIRRMQLYHEKMNEQVQRMDEFIQEIIAYSRNSRQDIKPCSIDLQRLARDSWNQFNYLNGAECIDFNITQRGSSSFSSDLARVKVLFNNIISNAIRYRDEEKDRNTLEIEIECNEKRALIHFRDNGIGIEEEFQQQIFEMFFRASNHSDGSGLGLYIVKETLDKLGGTVLLESKPGIGTCFSITLPNIQDTAQKPAFSDVG